MKSNLVLAASLFLALISKNSNATSFFWGQFQAAGPTFNCSVYNGTYYGRLVLGIQYQYSCQNVYTGAVFNYNPYINCFGGCGMPSGTTVTFIGPSSFNCNLVAASCYAITHF